MGLHHEHLHVAAHEARDSLGKRDSTNFHIPIEDNKYRFVHIVGKLSDEFKAHGDNFAPKGVTDDSDAGVVTVTRQVYVTEPKTFAGPAVYITKTTEVIQQGERTALPTMNSFESAKSAIHANTHRHQNSYESAKSLIQQSRTRSTAKNTITSNSNSLPTSGSVVKGSPITNDGAAQQSSGMSSGGKAGLAIGILAIIGLVAALAFFCVRRSKKRAAARGEKLDEKHASQNSFFSGTAAAVGAPAGNKRDSVRTMNSTHTAATAPRLSLRPVTQFLPNLAGPAMSEKPRNGPAQNPFSDPSRRSPSPAANPFEEGDGQGIKQGAAAVAAPASAGRPQNNVHRIQLDFKPSMDDELELKSGQLVRMLHEYDDGWVSNVSTQSTKCAELTLFARLFAFVWIARNKASAPVHACLSSLSNLVLKVPLHRLAQAALRQASVAHHLKVSTRWFRARLRQLDANAPAPPVAALRLQPKNQPVLVRRARPPPIALPRQLTMPCQLASRFPVRLFKCSADIYLSWAAARPPLLTTLT